MSINATNLFHKKYLPSTLLQMEWESYRKGTGYTAIGVSKDSKMGEDIMFVCSQVNEQYNLKIPTLY